MPIVDLENFADGAVAERFNIELKKVLENLVDPNTDAKKKRKVQLTVTVKGNEKRELAEIEISAKTTLAPANAIETTIIIDRDKNGITGKELKSGIPGQTFFDSETGEIKDDVGNNIVDYQKRRDVK